MPKLYAADIHNRDDVPKNYKWDLTHIYKSEDDWQNDFDKLESDYTRFAEFRGKVTESAQTLKATLDLDEELGITLGKLYLYAFLSKDMDMKVTKAMTRFGKIQGLAAKVSAESSFIVPEILATEQSEFDEISNHDSLKIYKQFFDNLNRKRSHTLSDKEEQLISQFSPVLAAPYNTFSLLKSTDLDFPTINVEGEELKLSDGKYSSLMYHQVNDVRESAYKEYYKPYIAHKNSLASTLDTAIKSMTIQARIRNHESSLHASLHSNNIPVSFFDSTINKAKENRGLLQRWARIKAKKLGKKVISPYDTYVSLFNAEGKKYSYAESMDSVMNGLAPLGEQYLDDVRDAINNGRIDVYETPGKRSGAYSSGTTYDTVPYVLLNWNDTLNDVFTFVHELGHNMHSLYTGNSQPYVYAGYSIFLAEVASITNEALLQKHLESETTDLNGKLYLHELFLNKCLTTFYRQLQFADFERNIHTKVESGLPLTPEYLSTTYAQVFTDFWGDSVKLEPEEEYSWTRIPHFYYNFYVYQYATGLVAGEWLADKILKDKSGDSVKDYLSFLHAGKSKYPMEILNNAGAKLEEDDPFDKFFEKIDNSLTFIEENM
jgi:oligoendopeptidase F